MRNPTVVASIFAIGLCGVSLSAGAATCPHRFTVADIDAVISETEAALEEARLARSDGGAIPATVERLTHHLELALSGNPDPQIDGLREMRDYHVAHPASPGQLFGGTDRILIRLHRASQVAAIAFASAGPSITATSRARAYDHTTRAMERLATLWRPISECYMEPYGFPPPGYP